jgi:hypothetical protein
MDESRGDRRAVVSSFVMHISVHNREINLNPPSVIRRSSEADTIPFLCAVQSVLEQSLAIRLLKRSTVVSK